MIPSELPLIRFLRTLGGETLAEQEPLISPMFGSMFAIPFPDDPLGAAQRSAVSIDFQPTPAAQGALRLSLLGGNGFVLRGLWIGPNNTVDGFSADYTTTQNAGGPTAQTCSNAGSFTFDVPVVAGGLPIPQPFASVSVEGFDAPIPAQRQISTNVRVRQGLYMPLGFACPSGVSIALNASDPATDGEWDMTFELGFLPYSGNAQPRNRAR